MAVVTPTPVNLYALGRDIWIDLLFQSVNATDPNAPFTVGMRLCISAGTVALDTDIIEVPSNCQAGWKVKIPTMKSGTLSCTGYVAASYQPMNNEERFNILNYLGRFCQVAIYHQPTDASGNVISTGESFHVQPKGPGANGVLKTASVSVSPDDVVKIDFTIELSGAQEAMAFVAVGAYAG